MLGAHGDAGDGCRSRHLTIRDLGAKDSIMVFAKNCGTISMPAGNSPMSLGVMALSLHSTAKRSAARVKTIWRAKALP
jgi:hypothetical protein